MGNPRTYCTKCAYILHIYYTYLIQLLHVFGIIVAQILHGYCTKITDPLNVSPVRIRVTSQQSSTAY